MVVHVAIPPVSARTVAWDITVDARPGAETETLAPSYRVAGICLALLAVVTAAVPVLIALALMVSPGGFARAFS